MPELKHTPKDLGGTSAWHRRILHFPENTNFNDFFTVSTKESGTRFCVAELQEKRVSFYAKVNPVLTEWINSNVMSIVYDEHYYFRIVEQNDGKLMLFFQYNQIIGSRNLAYLDRETIPSL